MQVEVDTGSGFCFGVVRAISKAEECIGRSCDTATDCAVAGGYVANECGGRLVSLGDIVHNGAETARLETLGLETVPEDTLLDDLAGRTVLIRAHGEPPETYRQARKHGITLVDATCPVVAALQNTVASAHAEMVRAGGQVVIFGRRGHAEVRGLEGHARVAGDGTDGTAVNSAARRGDNAAAGRVVVIENEADLDEIDFSRPIYFLAQTTSSLSEFRRLGDEIQRRMEATGADLSRSNNSPPLRLHDTICRQVSGREEHLAEFARRFDVVVFVSGAKSSNGRVLFETVRAANPRSHKIESAAELRPEWFESKERGDIELHPKQFCPRIEEPANGNGMHEISVGVCGATSTPRWLMNEVAEAISNIGKP